MVEKFDIAADRRIACLRMGKSLVLRSGSLHPGRIGPWIAMDLDSAGDVLRTASMPARKARPRSHGKLQRDLCSMPPARRFFKTSLFGRFSHRPCDDRMIPECRGHAERTPE
jgi:hypothetical protein